MKSLLKRSLQHAWVWKLIQASLGRVSGFYHFLEHARSWDEAETSWRAEARRKLEARLSGLTVKHGPFQGLKYPRAYSGGSAFFPKILGSYEAELHPVIESMLREPYSSIVDIGCAEGYYANGFGMRFPNAKVFACDTDVTSLQVCAEMAKLNGVNLETRGFCDAETLSQLPLGPRSLIILDCEGYEQTLIRPELVLKLRSHDFLIECHDGFQIEITRDLVAALNATHDISIIKSVDDIIKAYEYDYPELEGFTLQERKFALEEWRNSTMRWIYAKPKVASPL